MASLQEGCDTNAKLLGIYKKDGTLVKDKLVLAEKALHRRAVRIYRSLKMKN